MKLLYSVHYIYDVQFRDSAAEGLVAAAASDQGNRFIQYYSEKVYRTYIAQPLTSDFFLTL